MFLVLTSEYSGDMLCAKFNTLIEAEEYVKMADFSYQYYIEEV